MSFPPQFEAPSPEELHELLPAYDVLDFIAKGGMGAVYKARQKSLDREIAIKILPREFGEDAEFRKRFADEAKSMARLNHPNLIGVYDYGEVDHMPYIVMEFVNGKSLHHSAHGKVIDQKEVVRLVLGICEGLAHAHEAGILHRDIKPANILLDPKKRPKIGDFGLARAADDTEGEGVHFGTPDYTAPEVLKDPNAVAKQADVYSTGVILYELLTGKTPDANYVPASQIQDVDPRFDKIVRRATHPAPALRYADAGSMAKDVRELAAALEKPGATMVTKATATNLTKPAAGSEAAAAPAPPPQVLIRTGTNWNLLRNLIIIVVLIIAIFGMSKALKWKKEENERQLADQKKQEQAEKQAKIDAMLDERKRREKGQPVAVQPVNVPKDPEPEEPLEALARLKRSLAGGERTALPPGAHTRGTARFFFVETPMSWQRAANFAENHGGHLATCENESEQNWLSSKIPKDTTVWIGGGATGRSAWGWVDGTEWKVRTPSTSTGNCASLSDLGVIRAKPGGEQHPFFIKWHMDGSNPGALELQLGRLKESLDTPNPVYPPGVLSLESRRYLVVEKSVGWEEAASIARSAHGHLAVPSERTESDFLSKSVNAAVTEGAAWIGGQHNGRAWSWSTGEPWAFAAWAPDQPDGDPETHSVVRLVVGASGGWDDADPSDEEAATAFVIEWSKDRSAEREVVVSVGGGDWAALRTDAVKRVRAIEAGFAKKLAENGKGMKWDLDFWHKGLRDTDERTYAPAVARMKAQVQADGSIVIPDDERILLPPRGVEIIRGYVVKETELRTLLERELERARSAYVTALEEKKAKAETNGLTSEIRAIENEIAASGTDGASFREHFGTGE